MEKEVLEGEENVSGGRNEQGILEQLGVTTDKQDSSSYGY
jgi:hypothetical protein